MRRTFWIASFAALVCTTASTRADVLAYWRFEDQPIGSKLDAKPDANEPPYTETRSTAGEPNPLRTFNTRENIFPPDTSGTFIAPADLPKLPRVKNERCVRFVENQDFYTAKVDGKPAAIESAKLRRFTVEGLFKLDVLADRNGEEFQTIVGKDGQPIREMPFQPFVAVVGGKDTEHATRDCLAINVIDSTNTYRAASSRTKLEPNRWYAFAAVGDEVSLKLFMNRFDGRGYQLEGESPMEGGLIDVTEQWTVGRGMFNHAPNSWFRGSVDEIRISDEALPADRWLMANVKTLPPVAIPPKPAPPKPLLVVHDVADPAVLLHDGTYYLYGTSPDSMAFHVWSSRDLVEWTEHSEILKPGAGVWGDGAFWAPDIIHHKGKFYLYYSTTGILPYAGGPRSSRINVAVADSPLGPFKEIAPRMPLIGRAVIDPQVFIDADGKAFLYFVGDVSEGNGQIYVARLSDDLLSVVGEPVKCIERSQPWEGPRWNEGPFVFRDGDTYVLMYSGEFWASPDYAVGFATAPSPLGPWDKHDENPILHRYAGLRGTGHNSLVRAADGRWLAFFHAHRDERNTTRDTYVARLKVDRDARDKILLKIEPWEPRR